MLHGHDVAEHFFANDGALACNSGPRLNSNYFYVLATWAKIFERQREEFSAEYHLTCLPIFGRTET